MAIPYAIATMYTAMADTAPQMLADALVRRSFLFDRLRKVKASGKKTQWQPKTTGNSSPTGAFTIGGTMPTAGAAETIDAELGWGNYTGSFKIADRQLKELATAGDQFKIRDFMRFQLDDIIEGLVDKIAIDIISGSTVSDTAGTVIGLTSAIDDANTYAGINRGSVSEWQSYVSDLSSAPVTDVALAALLDTFKNTHKGRATVAFMDFNQWNAVADLAQAVKEAKNDTTGSNGISVFGGVTNLYYRGIPCVQVPGYTSGRIDFVDESGLEIRYLPATGGTESSQVIKQMFDLQAPEKDGDTWEMRIFAYCQLKLHNPRKQACSLQGLT